MKRQIIIIHGAGAFARLDRTNFFESLKKEEIDLAWCVRSGGDWKVTMQQRLGDEYEVFAPKMPDPDNPHYEAWKIWFEKIIAKIGDDVVLVGHSLGGAFLLKYLSEERIDKYVRGLFVVAAPFLENIPVYNERGFSAPSNFSGVKQAERLFFYYSIDDKIVSIKNQHHFQSVLPEAVFRELDGRGHFNKDDFHEILEDIQNLEW